METSSEKIYPATPSKRKKAREEGNVAKSNDLVSLLVLFCGILFIYLYREKIPKLMKEFLNLFYIAINKEVDYNIYKEFLEIMLRYVAPFLIVIVLAAFIGNYIQVGLKLTGKPLKPDLNKINLIKGAKRIFSKDSLIELVKALLKIAGVFLITWGELKEIVTRLPYMYNGEPIANFNTMFENIYKIATKASLLLLGVAIFDFAYKKFKFEKDLKMTRQEMMDEMKNSEGSPHVKQKQKEMARNLTKKQIQKVKEATVVITNPTHFAVALKYDRDTCPIPKVLFKGVDEIAQEIKKIAKENNVPIIENKPLARALYASVKEDQTIPKEMFTAVSEIIAQIYILNNQYKI